MKQLLLATFFLVATFSQVFSDGTFSYFPQRQRVEPDPELEKYLREAIENFREQMKEGIEAINMPVLDPLELQNLNIDVYENVATLMLRIKKLNIRCLSIFNITNLVPNLEEYYIAMNLSLPEIYADGEYSVDGRLMKILPIYGKGAFQINATELNIFGKGKLGFTNDTLEMKYLKLDFIWNNMSIFLENLLGGGNFAEVLQKVVADLGRKVFLVYKPMIMEKLEASITECINEKLNDDLVKDIIKGMIPH